MNKSWVTLALALGASAVLAGCFGGSDDPPAVTELPRDGGGLLPQNPSPPIRKNRN